MWVEVVGGRVGVLSWVVRGEWRGGVVVADVVGVRPVHLAVEAVVAAAVEAAHSNSPPQRTEDDKPPPAPTLTRHHMVSSHSETAESIVPP